MMKYLPFHYYFVYRHHNWYIHIYIDILIMLIYISTYLVCWNIYWYNWYVHIHIIFWHIWYADTQISIFGMFIYILTFHSYMYVDVLGMSSISLIASKIRRCIVLVTIAVSSLAGRISRVQIVVYQSLSTVAVVACSMWRWWIWIVR